MIAAKRQDEARVVLAAAFDRFGRKVFRVDRCGPNYRCLLDAEQMGWVWFVDVDRCGILEAGMRELAPERREYEPPLLEYVCAVCQRIVPDFDRGDGMPEMTGCPDCERAAAEAVGRMRRFFADVEDAA